jgi:hypothetical protein
MGLSVTEGTMFDLIYGIICLGIPAAIVTNAICRPPRKLYLDEWLSLLTVPMTLVEMGVLGRFDPLEANGRWLLVTVLVRLAYCAIVFGTSLAYCLSRVFRWPQIVARMFTLSYFGLLSAVFIFGLVFGVPYL